MTDWPLKFKDVPESRRDEAIKEVVMGVRPRRINGNVVCWTHEDGRQDLHFPRYTTDRTAAAKVVERMSPKEEIVMGKDEDASHIEFHRWANFIDKIMEEVGMIGTGERNMVTMTLVLTPLEICTAAYDTVQAEKLAKT